jgi:hypothetical protein
MPHPAMGYAIYTEPFSNYLCYTHYINYPYFLDNPIIQRFYPLTDTRHVL